MSGHGYESVCPVCMGSVNAYSDHKPHDYVSGECLDCGYSYYTKDDQMSLDDINLCRRVTGVILHLIVFKANKNDVLIVYKGGEYGDNK